MHKVVISSIFAILLSDIAGAQEFPALFPFQPTHNTPDNITNVCTWDGVSTAPAGNIYRIDILSYDESWFVRDGKTMK
ncbi:MAG: hypothetical protein MJY62_05600, partial [Bacteroidales bacterium]|nr:hypothetical protein [Bacteroidales bacterium]